MSLLTDYIITPKKIILHYEMELNASVLLILFVFFLFFFLFFLIDWILRHTDTVKVIWRRSTLTGGGRPQVPFRILFQARMGT
jgi:hypothetical protein